MPRLSPTRAAAGLLLAYPALLLTYHAIGAVQLRSPGFLAGALPLELVLIAVGVHLWRGRPWAHEAALVCSGALAAILVLYQGAVWWVWRGEMWEGWDLIQLVLEIFPIVALAAAFVMLARDTSMPAARYRLLALVAAALIVELVLVALIARYGVDGWIGGPWHQRALGRSQTPAVMILVQMGLCCGIQNHTVISDAIDPHWGPITLYGLPVLIAANTLGFVAIFAIARSILARLGQLCGRVARPAVPAP
ncbi:MAG TPA: hypothetical protein VFT45_09525 [Longimicrobium sp.]|nr:hypothetical protein [Longimicrobium sp.]